MTSKYEQVKKDFLSGRIKGCKNFFEKNKNYVEAGYCNIILDNLKQANEDFDKAISDNIRAHWGKLLIQMITGQISSAPTYFEIRNFLEIDLLFEDKVHPETFLILSFELIVAVTLPFVELEGL